MRTYILVDVPVYFNSKIDIYRRSDQEVFFLFYKIFLLGTKVTRGRDYRVRVTVHRDICRR